MQCNVLPSFCSQIISPTVISMEILTWASCSRSARKALAWMDLWICTGSSLGLTALHFGPVLWGVSCSRASLWRPTCPQWLGIVAVAIPATVERMCLLQWFGVSASSSISTTLCLVRNFYSDFSLRSDCRLDLSQMRIDSCWLGRLSSFWNWRLCGCFSVLRFYWCCVLLLSLCRC